ncbi:tetratricopeptide repeat protein [Brachyspira alvinipulli]|uniref:tetratricopeptide repeat protein n=1 Tax=Brachyspira alvinipulli TaxID=84379 RepID=UPI000485F623|nr:tetratricopeptide repeat protein [Brachyspira alvinipulli]
MGLLHSEDIEILKSFKTDKGGYFYKMLSYLEDFIEKGIKENRFTLEEAQEDLDIALWYSYACNNIGDYEHYYMSKEFMKYSEKNAKGCGTWYYRYTCSLIYCGKLEEALKYSEKGVIEEPDYPWGWLELARLRLHFGDKQGAVEANNKGLELVPGDYEFSRQAEELENYYSIEALHYHYINEDSDKKLLEGLDYGEDKLKSIAYILCDEEKLQAIKDIIKPIDWEADNPYCSFKFYIDDKLINGMFIMNEAAISKFDKELIKNSLEELREVSTVIKENENLELIFVRFNIDYTIEAEFENKETGESSIIKKKFNSDSEYKKVADDIFDSYGMPLDPYLEELPNIVTLYKKEDDYWYYAECWIDNDNTIIKHTGIVGNTGKVEEYECDNAREYKNFLDEFYKEYEDYEKIFNEDCSYLILQFEIEPFENELPEKYNNVIENIVNILNSVLNWNGVGVFYNWNAGETENIKGKYVINLLSIVVNTDIAFRLILNEVIDKIKDNIDCSHFKIASIPYDGDIYTLHYSEDSSTDFSI